jgi:hypothetical protein
MMSKEMDLLLDQVAKSQQAIVDEMVDWRRNDMASSWVGRTIVYDKVELKSEDQCWEAWADLVKHFGPIEDELCSHS